MRVTSRLASYDAAKLLTWASWKFEDLIEEIVTTNTVAATGKIEDPELQAEVNLLRAWITRARELARESKP